MFPQNIAKVDIRPISFNDKRIKEIFIDLDHVNKGKAGRSKRSSLTLKDVLKFVFFLDELSIEPEMMRGNYLYYSRVLKDEFEKPYKMIFCQDHSLSWIGVITLYRIRVEHEN
jgi:hypothetical protein